MIRTKFYVPFVGFLTLMLLSSLSFCKSKKELELQSETQGNQVAQLIAEIMADDFIGTRQMARIQTDSPAWIRRQELMSKATDGELIDLWNHNNIVVKLTAYEGLYRRKHPEVRRMFDELKNDNVKFSYINGDIYISMPALEYAFTYVMGYAVQGENLPYYDVSPTEYLMLSDEEQREVSRLIARMRTLRNE